jgi:hypothetical protein
MAICSAYLTGTLALVNGLRAGAQVASSNLPDPPLVAFRGSDLEGSRIAAEELRDLRGAHAAFYLLGVSVVAGSGFQRETYAVAVDDPGDVARLGVWAPAADGVASVGPDLWGDVEAFGADPSVLHVDGLPLETILHPEQIFVPNDWVIVSLGTMKALGGPEAPNFLLVTEASDGEALADRGYDVIPAAGSSAFLRQGVEGASRTLASLVGATTAVALLLVSSLMALEVRHRGPELRLLRALGGSRRTVARFVIAQGAYVGLLGALLGIALGTMASHGLASIAPYVGVTNVLEPRVDGWALLLNLAVVPLSALAGGLGALLRPWGEEVVP